MKNTLYIVVPCYNEEACLDETNKRLSEKLDFLVTNGKIDKKSRIVYVDDGSKDKTWEKIESFSESSIGIKLSRNRGHQNALLAGLMHAKDHADMIVSMDADLQDDVDAIDKMIEKFEDGYEVIYGVRSERKTDSAFKRNTALAFYKIMNALGAEVVYNSADFRLMSKRAVEELAKFKEVNLFLRGLVPLVGLKSTEVKYARAKRFAGESKYPLKKMLKFAWDGITSFSIKPIRMILWLGVLIFVISLLVTIYALIMKLVGNTVSGWTFIICSIWFLGGLQMISLGLVGEYVGKIYAESKGRPRYTIEKIVRE